MRCQTSPKGRLLHRKPPGHSVVRPFIAVPTQVLEKTLRCPPLPSGKAVVIGARSSPLEASAITQR